MQDEYQGWTTLDQPHRPNLMFSIWSCPGNPSTAGWQEESPRCGIPGGMWPPAHRGCLPQGGLEKGSGARTWGSRHQTGLGRSEGCTGYEALCVVKFKESRHLGLLLAWLSLASLASGTWERLNPSHFGLSLVFVCFFLKERPTLHFFIDK